MFLPAEVRTITESVVTNNENRHPFKAELLHYNEFFDMKKLLSQFMKNLNIDSDGNAVQWLKIKQFRFKKGECCVEFKYSYDDSDYQKFNFLEKPYKRARRKPATHLTSEEVGKLKLCCLYSARLGISVKKKKDFLELISKGVIRAGYADFYKNLNGDENVDDIAEVEESETELEVHEIGIR